MTSVRRILVTTALPYANGPLHLGHLLDHLQSDIWARFQKLRGHECHFICASDAHGTPIMLNAQKQGLPPETLIEQIRADHQTTLKAFEIHYDAFYTTHSPENQQLAEKLYHQLCRKGDIVTRAIEQAFDPKEHLFLPDRYVKGECPRCAAQDQYGDSCEICGATYTPLDLKNPRSVLSGVAPIQKRSEHYFFQLPRYRDLLENWLAKTPLQPQVANKLKEWFETGLCEWDISRDSPYFGFKIPGTTDKYFYVWLDAPIGYMASFLHYCQQKQPQLNFDDFWDAEQAKQSGTELHHFMGKDIIYFHGLFWPALLAGSGHRLPSHLQAHGFLTIDGQKMSKSRGTFITAQAFLEKHNPTYLRYYLAAKLSNSVEDIDLKFDDLVTRVNVDLVGKFVNIASRCAGFLATYFNHRLGDNLSDPALYQHFVQQGEIIAAYFEEKEYSRALREIMLLADEANRFIDLHKPWIQIKQAEQRGTVQAVCTQGINLFRLLSLYLKPIIPSVITQAEDFLKAGPLHWSEAQMHPLLAHTLNPFTPLLTRLDKETLMTLIPPSIKESVSSTPEVTPEPTWIDSETFAKIDLRVAKILNAESVPEAEKLLKLTLDLNEQQPRTVFAGLKAAYAPEALIGKLTVVVANLAPRKMRFGLSEGMVLAAGPGGQDLWILEPHEGAQAGMKVK